MLEPLNEIELHLELKYCERCGGLWLRGADADCVFCARCNRQLVEDSARLADSRRRHA